MILGKKRLTLRDKRQLEFAEMFLKSPDKRGVLHLCPRFGKIFTSINILERMDWGIRILIAYPDMKIKKSWEEDFKIRKYNDCEVTYTTHLSIKKHVDEKFDIVIIDEIHLLSEAQIEACKLLFKKNKVVLGLTGTLTYDSEKTLYDELNLQVIGEYSIEQGIIEGVTADYEIHVLQVPLDNKTFKDYKGKKKTEKKHFDNISWVIDNNQRQGIDTMFLRLARMRVIQNSLAKLNATKHLLNQFANERILVFCGITKIADALGIPSYHSKSTEKQIFTDFTEGKGNHLAVVKIGNTGITYTPLNKVIINYFDSNAQNLTQKINRCMSMEYDNPDKKAMIYIICTTENVEQKWLNKALEFFDKDKIKYYN